MNKIIGALIVISMLNGCAYIAQTARIQPHLIVAESTIGQGKEVMLKVVDERPNQELGRRGAGFGSAAAITTTQDVATILKAAISDGLRKKGFVPVEQSQNSVHTMTVEIRLIEYTTSTGFWTGGVETRSAFKVICTNANAQYSKIYRAEKEERVMMVPTARHNEDLINEIVTDGLQKIFTDEQLFTFLAEEKNC